MTSPTLIDLPIRGMTCAGCAGRAERATGTDTLSAEERERLDQLLDKNQE